MSKPIVDLGENVIPLNPDAVRYHMALQAAHNDLYLIFCLDLWANPMCATKEGLAAFVARFKSTYTFMTVPIAPESAAELVDEVMVAEDVAQIGGKGEK